MLLTTDGLSEAQLRALQADGYVVLRGALPRAAAEAIADDIWRHLGMRPDRRDEWYDPALRARTGLDERGMIPWYHGQSLWDARTNLVLHAAFAAIWGREDLAVSIDRVNFNAPVRDGWEYDGFIHWDIDVAERPIATSYQGILALTDAPPKAGGFQCAPGFHNEIEAWLDRQGPGYRTRFPDPSGMDIRPVEMAAGDFLIFHGALPHGNMPNHSAAPRMAQYITMIPADRLDDALRAERLTSLALNTPPRSFSGAVMPAPLGPPYAIRLDERGEKLLGARSW